MSFALAVGQRSGTPFPGLARLFWTPSRQAGARGPVTGFATWTCSRSTTAFRDSGADRTSTRTCNCCAPRATAARGREGCEDSWN